MTRKVPKDSIADKLEGTRWDYSQRHDRSFLLEPIGEIFATFRWDGKPDRVIPLKRESDAADSED